MMAQRLLAELKVCISQVRSMTPKSGVTVIMCHAILCLRQGPKPLAHDLLGLQAAGTVTIL